jgi:hypothetical protein
MCWRYWRWKLLFLIRWLNCVVSPSHRLDLSVTLEPRLTPISTWRSMSVISVDVHSITSIELVLIKDSTWTKVQQLVLSPLLPCLSLTMAIRLHLFYLESNLTGFSQSKTLRSDWSTGRQEWSTLPPSWLHYIGCRFGTE